MEPGRSIVSLAEYGLKNKTALVTGAGSGIGYVICKQLYKAGAHVIAVSRTLEHLEKLKQECQEIQIICCNLTDWEATEHALKYTKADLVVNNAGVALLEPVGHITESAFNKTFNLNTKAAINVIQCCLPHMKSNKHGAIVNISSQAGISAIQDHAVYAASKAALDQLTRVFALELGQYNIRVNSVNPTVTLTPMSQVGWSDPAKAKGMKDKIPLGRFATPEDVTDAVLYLLSDKSAMITGTILPIDGGFTAC
ncbi:L-xylulose reductase-like isoform X1 [Varroa jacobsoni]|uniref:Ketoreductase domain-containing protein n=1 Tax=Varroa destructor TaxID=109461 RepID=A0A7M7K173_VARDE|nr:L-xylulose reductase-like isoform X1 [Varroa destructor]XP_022659900.1 L-xylulose reductase-like isoform X1 [Varroa destructor]XP_022659901.1 L-xylulose reductase-like isoform X1 [Varroa destructor]XP_022659902.1 L-xylulose reductase-like isoform X1 [Varroa destructor]XP_022659903.1 L-xylulose reductase-like isoform X1 [Varroa destructor]XP_022659904.1 L-xylulose reductase-like isoform X1 [Varroa destructor]XP_022659905.1 L-xylulose reductase-like isoform X1 [Varroa destructor]XP_02265990